MPTAPIAVSGGLRPFGEWLEANLTGSRQDLQHPNVHYVIVDRSVYRVESHGGSPEEQTAEVLTIPKSLDLISIDNHFLGRCNGRFPWTTVWIGPAEVVALVRRHLHEISRHAWEVYQLLKERSGGFSPCYREADKEPYGSYFL